jgi:hypothetical protein
MRIGGLSGDIGKHRSSTFTSSGRSTFKVISRGSKRENTPKLIDLSDANEGTARAQASSAAIPPVNCRRVIPRHLALILDDMVLPESLKHFSRYGRCRGAGCAPLPQQ